MWERLHLIQWTDVGFIEIIPQSGATIVTNKVDCKVSFKIEGLVRFHQKKYFCEKKISGLYTSIFKH